MKKKQVGGNKDEPKLTKKQQELVQNQIQKETTTRNRLKEVGKFSVVFRTFDLQFLIVT